jgi:hypothetical protein
MRVALWAGTVGSRSGLEDEAYALFGSVPEGFDIVPLCGLELELDGLVGDERRILRWPDGSDPT